MPPANPGRFNRAKADIDRRLTKPNHPWTNGQVERMNWTIKDATVKRFYYETHDQLRSHLGDFVADYNFPLEKTLIEKSKCRSVRLLR
jgi:transposase InsO family protein